MPDDLELVNDGLAFSIADAGGCDLADAEHLIRQLIIRARQAYCAAGAPFGPIDSDRLCFTSRKHPAEEISPLRIAVTQDLRHKGECL